jgi:hypothetical protein
VYIEEEAMASWGWIGEREKASEKGGTNKFTPSAVRLYYSRVLHKSQTEMVQKETN